MDKQHLPSGETETGRSGLHVHSSPVQLRLWSWPLRAALPQPLNTLHLDLAGRGPVSSSEVRVSWPAGLGRPLVSCSASPCVYLSPAGGRTPARPQARALGAWSPALWGRGPVLGAQRGGSAQQWTPAPPLPSRLVTKPGTCPLLVISTTVSAHPAHSISAQPSGHRAWLPAPELYWGTCRCRCLEAGGR